MKTLILELPDQLADDIETIYDKSRAAYSKNGIIVAMLQKYIDEYGLNRHVKMPWDEY